MARAAAMTDRVFVIVEDEAALAEEAARRLITRSHAHDGSIAVCLTGGSTPRRLYELLGAEPFRGELPWHRIDWFIGDERFVPAGDPLSNIGMARKAFLDECAAPARIHPIRTDLSDPPAAARDYERLLKAHYGTDMLNPGRPLFDLVLMGVGPDGHTASLFPGKPAVDESHRWVVEVDEAGVEPFVPRVTLTLPVLASCREMLFLIAGSQKRAVLERVLADASLPAARALSQRQTIWLMDREAAPGSLR
jgi:6-phosphogluconolactonase